MKFTEKVRTKIGFGVLFILFGILIKTYFNFGLGIMVFHLIGGILIVLGIMQALAEKN